VLGFKKRFAGRIAEQIKELQKLVDPELIRLEKIAFRALGPKGYKDLSPYICKTINEYPYKNDLEKSVFWVARLIRNQNYYYDTNINKYSGKTFSFKRRPKRRKFRNPIFLSLK
jgi:hypothetical protein